MFGYVLQDWITIKQSSASTVIQNESDWLEFSLFQDIVFWLDIQGLTLNTVSGSMIIALQTSPTKDDILFQTLSNCSVNLTTIASPYNASGVLPKCMLASNPTMPLGTWVRWSITTTVANTDITFRILCSANRTIPMRQ